MSKTLLLGLGAGASAFAAVTASAATLGTITSHNLGAATSVVAPCDTDGVDLSYSTAYDGALNGGVYEVVTAVVGSLNAACNGQAIKITLSNDGGAAQGSATGTVAAGAATLTLSADTPVAAVTRAVIVISGAVGS
ncbi:MAG: hypothetical protein JWN22_994 [Nocardioides sp.]|jgi:hypothetical protein|nr:hypothetical protein [Nocardioides sp.]